MRQALTPRQAQVVALLGSGLTYKAAGTRLRIAASTVGEHASRAYRVLFEGRSPLTLSTLDPMAKTVRPENRATVLVLIANVSANKAGTNRHRDGRGGSRKGGIRRRGPNGSQILNPAKRRASIRRYVTRAGRRAA